MDTKMDLSHDLERIIKHRDRFSAWALVLGFISFTIAVWTTAPSLEVKLPLVAGTDVNINIGYILSIGIPVLTFALGLAYGALFSMKSYQVAIIEKIKTSGSAISPSEAITIVGPGIVDTQISGVERVGLKVSIWLKIVIFFALPVIAQIWILAAYSDLSIYKVDSTIAKNNKKQDQLRWNIYKERELGIFTEWEVSQPEYTYIPDSALEEECAKIFVDDKIDNSKCVYSNFPRFMPIVNTIVNVLFFIVLLIIVRAGYLIYTAREIAPKILLALEAKEEQ